MSEYTCYYCGDDVTESVDDFNIDVLCLGVIYVCLKCKNHINEDFIYLKRKTERESKRLQPLSDDDEEEEEEEKIEDYLDPPWENDYNKFTDLYFIVRVSVYDKLIAGKLEELADLRKQISLLKCHKRKAEKIENEINGTYNHRITKFFKRSIQ
jgi:DNA-directed RNA polymerase subunit RPC12/RpoP